MSQNQMSNAQNITNEISMFLSKSMLKSSKITKAELIAFIEQKWAQADDEKYNIHQGYIIIGRMTNEYIWAKDFDNMMRWLDFSDIHSSSAKNATYIRNYYKGACCLECAHEEKALEYFNLCYAENPDYIFTRAASCYELFNKHLQNPRVLPVKIESDVENVDFMIELKHWKEFFNEKNEGFYYNLLDEDGEYICKPSKVQQQGLDYLQNNQELVLKNILETLLKKYSDLQKIYHYSEEDKVDFMPDLNDIQGFAVLLSPGHFYVTSVVKDNHPYIGFIFSCSWDSEHGLGVMMHQDRVIGIEGADLAFDTWTAEKDLKQTKQ